jgi:acyl-coenzyme A thioesterase PaaI-like protein
MSVPTPPRRRAVGDALRAAALALPPAALAEMGAEVRDYLPGAPETGLSARLVARFPVETHHADASGHLPAGRIAAFVDAVLAPLCDLAAPPSHCTQLALTILAPLPCQVPAVEVTGTLTARSSGTVSLEATVTAPDGAVLATAHSTRTLLRGDAG